MAATIFSGDKIKALLPALGLGDNATIRSGTVNPQSSATAGNRGDVYIRTGASPTIYQKITTDGTDTNWALVPASLAALAASSVVVTDTLGNIKTDAELTYDSTTNNLSVGGTVTASNFSGSSSGTNTGDVTLTAVGSSPSANGATLSGQALTLQPADATHPGAITTGSQTIAGSKTLSGLLNADGGIDRSSAGTLTIGATNSTTINIGNSGATVNIQGTTIYENTPLLQVADPLITVNHGGSAGSGQNAGIEIEENSIITGYAETSSNRNSWIFKAPNTAGIITATPGSSGFTIDQGSHNPVTLGVANGLSLTTQVLGLDLSGSSSTGALSNTDWNTFNNKQASGNYITALTGDATASGPGSVALTLATVNGNVGSFGTATQTSAITVNAKGLITAASNTSIQIAESQVTNLVSDLAGKQATGNYITALTGDVTASGPGSVASTVAKIAGTTVSGTTGSTNVVFSSAPTLSNPVVGTQSQGDASTKAASTAYVDTAVANAVAGINPAVAVQAASTANLTGYTYSNGVSGVGATLTAGSNNVALTVDGYTFTALGQRLLVKDQSSGFQNGVYYVTQVQTSILPVILTRTLDYNIPSDINNTGAIPVVNGTVNGTTTWVQTAQITTIGTDSLVFVKFTRNPADYLLVANNLSDVGTKATAFNNLSPMTTGGDLIYGGASGTGTRLANGSAGQVLTSSGTTVAPTWASAPFPTTVGAGYNTAAGQSIPDSSTTIINFGGSYFTDGNVTTGASWHYTAPSSGKYLVIAHIQWDSASWTSGNYYFSYIRKNGGDVFRAFRTIQASFSGYLDSPISGVLDVSTNDTIDVTVFQNAGGARSLIASNSDNWISIVKVGN